MVDAGSEPTYAEKIGVLPWGFNITKPLATPLALSSGNRDLAVG